MTQVPSNQETKQIGSTEDGLSDLDSQDPTHYVVGVGASAGGLEALEQFFGAASIDSPNAFVVVQHLSPDFPSMMDDLLKRVTDLPIKVISDRAEVESGTIYLLPPGSEVIVSEWHLLLSKRPVNRELSFPIDQFFRSLATEYG